MFWLQLIVVLGAIFIGARLGGIALGVMGGLGLAVLTFVFHLQPTSPPIDVMLMIAAVVTAAGVLQGAGGLDYLVRVAERILRSKPDAITYLGPVVTYVFTLFAGTGHVAYSVLPVISEVALETGVRPERPLSISVIASQQAITASPISAATVALLGMLSTGTAAAAFHIELIDILKVCIPSTFLGCMIAAFVVNRMGRELADDPEYKHRVEIGAVPPPHHHEPALTDGPVAQTSERLAKIAVVIFLLGAVSVVLFGSFPALRPVWKTAQGVTQLGMPHVIEIVMLSVSALMLLVCRVDVGRVVNGSVFIAGIQAVIAIFGIAWMGDTFFGGNIAMLSGNIKNLVTSAPWLFAIALFALSVLLYSQAATVRALMPLGITLGISSPALIAMFPSVNGYFFIPNYPTVVAAINFDRTGTTGIGKYVLNHSFMVPGLIATASSIAIGLLMIRFMF